VKWPSLNLWRGSSTVQGRRTIIMSFEWNLSSEDEEDLEEWTRREGFSGEGGGERDTDAENSAASPVGVDRSSAAQTKGWNDDIFGNGIDDEEEESSDVDWEDAEQDEAVNGTATATTPFAAAAAATGTVEISLRPVTILMGPKSRSNNAQDEENTKKKKKKRAALRTRRVLRHDALSKNLQSLLCNLHRTHLLTLTSHACFVSRVCSNQDVMAMAHSIIPCDIMITRLTAAEKRQNSAAATATATAAAVGTARASSANDDNTQQHAPIMADPTMNELKSFCQFYFDLVHRVNYRLQARRVANVAAGAPRYHNHTTRPTRSRRRLPQQNSGNIDNKAASSIVRLLSVLGSESSTFLAECPEKRLQDYASFLAYSTRGDDPQLNEMNMNNNDNKNQNWTPLDQNQLFISMTRSLGWRTRYVQSMDPIKSDLDVNHPLLMTCSNIFQLLNASTNNKKKAASQSKRQRTTVSTISHGGNDGKKQASSTSKDNGTPTLQDDHDDDGGDDSASMMNDCSSTTTGGNAMLEWCEVLCRDPTAPSQLRWIMVDPAHQLVNRPDQVELLLTTTTSMATPTLEASNRTDNTTSCTRRNKNLTTNKRTTIAYALAVEHVAIQRQQQQEEPVDTALRVRFTDVTPRYAESYTESLKLRGMLGRSSHGKKVLLTEAELAKTWWAATLRKLNHSGKEEKGQSVNGKKKAGPEATGGGSSAGDAIPLLDDDDNDEADKNKKSSATASNDDDDLDKKMPAIERKGENDQPSLDDALDRDEHVELQKSAKNEVIPTSKNAFRTHPVYVIPSVLGVAEVLDPTAKKRMCGVFKGELVYRRQEVSTALVAKKWLYKGRQVRSNELAKPVKRVKARKKPISKNFKALKSYGFDATNDGSEQQRSEIIRHASQPLEENDGMVNLYAHWQTDPWSPTPVDPTDAIPVNEYKNIERDLLNPGLVHIDARGVAAVAKKLGIPYAPCMLGFEPGQDGGTRVPCIRGIVVHAHNEAIMREASAEVSSYTMQQEQDSRRRAALQRWKKLFVGLLTKDRLEREYKDDDDDE
jgi:xeroderma pigmentosum group C-complementing protein